MILHYIVSRVSIFVFCILFKGKKNGQLVIRYVAGFRLTFFFFLQENIFVDVTLDSGYIQLKLLRCISIVWRVFITIRDILIITYYQKHHNIKTKKRRMLFSLINKYYYHIPRTTITILFVWYNTDIYEFISAPTWHVYKVGVCIGVFVQNLQRVTFSLFVVFRRNGRKRPSGNLCHLWGCIPTYYIYIYTCSTCVFPSDDHTFHTGIENRTTTTTGK